MKRSGGPQCLAFLLLLSAVTYLNAQSRASERLPDQAIAITSNAYHIAVDVVVTDNNDRPVTGLREQDFQLLEDNKPQSIRSFRIHEEQSGPAIPKVASLPENTFTNAGNSAAVATNVFLLDQLNTEMADQELARQSLIKYLQHGPSGSVFAIFVLRPGNSLCVSCDSLRMVQGVTEDTERLIAALNSPEAQPQPKPLRIQVANGDVEDTTMSSMAEIGEFLKNLPRRKNLIWLAGNFDAAPIAEESDIWFSPKFKGWKNFDPFSKTQVLHLAASRLALARVALYPVDLTGKNKSTVIKRVCWTEEPRWTQDPENVARLLEPGHPCERSGSKLDYIAAQSGGRAFHDAAAIQQSIAQAVADGTSYYTLTYSPSNAKFDAKVRNIKVAVNRKDCHLRFRHKYFADNPSTVNRPGNAASSDITLPVATGRVPWTVARVSSSNPPQPSDPEDPILRALRYGTPPSRGIVFVAHVQPNDKPVKATPAQMEELQNYDSFRQERVEKAVQNLTLKEKDRLRKGVVFNSLPPPDPVFLQRYSIDYSMAASDLTLMPADNGKNVGKIEASILAYDSSGKKIAGFKDVIGLSVVASKLQQFRASEYRVHQIIDVPERAAVLRLAVRDVSSDRTGSLEIPVSSISSRYQRQRLELFIDTEEGGRRNKKHK
jgi:VWFA-related protein